MEEEENEEMAGRSAGGQGSYMINHSDFVALCTLQSFTSHMM